MLNPIELYEDESLESCLLRISQNNCYDSFQDFSDEVWFQVKEEDREVRGTFPATLNTVNIYHSHTSSDLKLKALIKIEQWLEINNSPLLKSALSRSSSIFLRQHSAVFRNGVDIPRILLRKNGIPVCPECLKENEYIRQEWHFITHDVCTRHKIGLLHHCPECKASINYQKIENITVCQCGFKFSDHLAPQANSNALLIAQWLNGENTKLANIWGEHQAISSRFGVLLWYINRYNLTDDFSTSFVKYSLNWPTNFYSELDEQIDKAKTVQIKPFNKIFFNEIFDSLLLDCQRLPTREFKTNSILSHVYQYFLSRYQIHPNSDVFSILLSPLEASSLLSCTTDQIYRLYELGFLKLGVRPKLHQKIASHQSVFTLSSIILVKLSNMQSSQDELHHYLSAW